MLDRVHIEEKWFPLTKENETYYLCPGEAKPARRSANKHHISKVMFFCAQARPRHDPNTNQYWDGKIGIWPIGKYAPAARKSSKQPAGTMVWNDKTVTNAYSRELFKTSSSTLSEEDERDSVYPETESLFTSTTIHV